MWYPFPVIAILSSLTPAAHATTCTYGGSAPAYVNCIRDDLATAMADIELLRDRLETLEAEAVRSVQPVTLSLGFLQYDDPILSYTAPDGTTDSIDLTGIVDGDVRFGPGGLLAVQDAATGDAVIYVNIDDVGSHTCTVLAHDDDVPRPGRYVATDTGGNVTVWGPTSHATLMVAREGEGDLPMANFEGLAFACF